MGIEKAASMSSCASICMLTHHSTFYVLLQSFNPKKTKPSIFFKLLWELYLLVQNGEWSYFYVNFPAFVTEHGLYRRAVYNRSHSLTDISIHWGLWYSNNLGFGMLRKNNTTGRLQVLPRWNNYRHKYRQTINKIERNVDKITTEIKFRLSIYLYLYI